ncbi:DUF3800 domain-containing protein [Donghicola tyrosinivorans]|uniref:Uncharacterized protein DUF3800 n=1 Tax=Donghicola tyrosinivorans TaxID=1652492 RepID=A0A2T0X0L5_9RHOB|nr:DUF3800 domain-containing protein [Donghicola tyrosinivorans]PRY92457.1 uncharacterized protein DUF3800 [Donghicola tyrosinivorans]
MHFFYLDETGCSGENLNDAQKVFVLGGVSVKDKSWTKVCKNFTAIISNFFDGQIPAGFELHSHELMYCNGPFQGRSRREVDQLAFDILDLIINHSIGVHSTAIDKTKLGAIPLEDRDAAHDIVSGSSPYMIAFNYMISYVERYVKKQLGQSARGMFIIDIKDDMHEHIDRLTAFRRYKVAQARRLKWVVEFSYPVDSEKHPMIQLSDFVIYIIRKFLEIDLGYEDPPAQAKDFYARAYQKVSEQVKWQTLLEVPGREEAGLNEVLSQCFVKHSPRWKTKFGIV